MTNKRFSFFIAEAIAKESPQPFSPLQYKGCVLSSGNSGKKMELVGIFI
jgi:hypothetical protein